MTDDQITHLVLVSMAGPSLEKSFGFYKKQLPPPAGVYQAWQEIRLEAKEESLRTRKPHHVNATPFSELASLQDADETVVPLKKITLVLLGNDSDEDPLIPSVDGTRHTLLEYVQAFGQEQYPDAEFVAEWLAMDGYSVLNAGPDTPALRAIIMDHCAGVSERFAGSTETLSASTERQGPRPLIIANAVAGANIAVDALVFAADELGWQAWYRATERVRFVPRDLNPSALADQWGRAQALVERNKSTSFTRETLRKPMQAADEDGVLSFVVPRGDDANGFSLGMNRLGMALFRKHAASGRHPYSATWRLLERLGTPESVMIADRFQELLKHWARADLFGSNQVSELVAHTESHCEAVDRNVASVAGPLLDVGVLTVQDVFNLGVAAWLHDWGHSGAAFSLDRDLARIQDAQAIRDVHGILSADRIRSMQTASGLSKEERLVPALLAAHHQGWTSLGDEEPKLKDALAQVPHRSWSLTSDINNALDDGLTERDAEQIPLLVAIFRVCDAADVGVHRAYYVDVIEDRIADEIMLKARRDVNDDQKLRVRLPLLKQAITNHLHKTPRPHHDDFDWPCGDVSLSPDSAATANAITKWARHCLEQITYFDHHRHVLGVHLAMVQQGTGWTLTPLVAPLADDVWAAAAKAVNADIHRELGEDVYYNPDGTVETREVSPPKLVVKKRLQAVGISVGFARQLG